MPAARLNTTTMATTEENRHPATGDLQRIRQGFMRYQRVRLQRIRSELDIRQRQFLDLLPLLLHINHPSLPGFVSDNTACGIVDYPLEQALLQQAKGLYPPFNGQHRAHLRYWISGVYLTGNMGELTPATDPRLAVWVFHQSGLDEDECYLLDSKLQKLADEAGRFGLTLQMGLIEPQAFCRNARQTLHTDPPDRHHPQPLPLHSFYLNSVYLAGNPLMWWLLPPEPPGPHQTPVAPWQPDNPMDTTGLLELGSLRPLPPKTFCHQWQDQLQQALQAPCKSVLDLIRSELEAAAYPHNPWLCDDLKQLIQGESVALETLDSQQLVYRRVETYLLDRSEYERLDLARHCLYLTTDRPLLRRRPRDSGSWQRQLLEQLTAQWDWQKNRLQHLDGHRRWKIGERLPEQHLLSRELTRSYRQLVAFVQQHSLAAQINPKALNILGRKLFACLEPRPGKINRLNNGLPGDLSEPLLSLHRNEGRYQLFSGEPETRQQRDIMPIKQSCCLTELLAWGRLNGLINPQTRIRPHPAHQIDHTSLQGMDHALSQWLADHPESREQEQPRAFAQKPRLRHSALFINPEGLPAAVTGSIVNQLVSDRSDPLSFSSKRLSLIGTVEQLIVTSWGETLCFRYQGAQALLEALVKFLRLTIGMEPDKLPAEVASFCFNQQHGVGIARRIHDLFRFIAHIYGPQGPGRHSRYLLPLGQGHYIIQHDGKHYSWRHLTNTGQLYAALAEPANHYSPIIPDPQSLNDTPLPCICARRAKGRLQLFFHARQHSMDTYVVDESGSIFFQTQSGIEPKYQLSHQHRFLRSLSHQRGLSDNAAMTRLLRDNLDLYQLNRQRQGNWTAQMVSPPEADPAEELLQLRLICPPPGENEQILLSYGATSFSSSEYGDAIYANTARHILSLRKPGQTYPIYINNIEPQSFSDSDECQTMRLLQLKQRIEQQLNQEMGNALTAPMKPLPGRP
jgi:adenylate cyclase class 1